MLFQKNVGMVYYLDFLSTGERLNDIVPSSILLNKGVLRIKFFRLVLPYLDNWFIWPSKMTLILVLNIIVKHEKQNVKLYIQLQESAELYHVVFWYAS